MVVLSSLTLEQAIFDVVEKKGLISYNRLANILYHQPQYGFGYTAVLNECKKLLKEDPPILKAKQVTELDLSLWYGISQIFKRIFDRNVRKKSFWFYYVDENEFNRRKKYVFNLTHKWVFKLPRNKGDFFRDLTIRAIEKILRDKKYKGWKFKDKGKEIKEINGTPIDRKIDILLELPDKSLLWIECKNQTKLVTRKIEINKFVNDVNHVEQKLPNLVFRMAIICPKMSRRDEQGCLRGKIIYPLLTNRLYIPNNKFKEDYDECIKEFELDPIVEQIDENYDPPELETLLRHKLFRQLAGLPSTTKK